MVFDFSYGVRKYYRSDNLCPLSELRHAPVELCFRYEESTTIVFTLWLVPDPVPRNLRASFVLFFVFFPFLPVGLAVLVFWTSWPEHKIRDRYAPPVRARVSSTLPVPSASGASFPGLLVKALLHLEWNLLFAGCSFYFK